MGCEDPSLRIEQGAMMLDSTDRRTKIVTIGHGETVKEAAARMLSHNVGCLIVNDDEGKFIGLVTEREIAQHVAASPDCGAEVQVGRIMLDHLVSCPPGIGTGEARSIMMAHGIRHLPVVDQGVVVGILSARDVMDRQLLEDRAAAEEVAMLSKCLRSIDLTEAAEIVATEAPKLFKAHNSVLCLYPDGDRSCEPELVSSHRCPCLAGHLQAPEIEECDGAADCYYREDIPAECRSQGGEPPRLILPLEIVGLPEVPAGSEKRLCGYLCMCGLASASAANSELTSYKAKLTREIVVAHLSNATRYQQARLTSLTDALTGVGSRKLLEDKLQEECDRARRYERPFSVAIIDLDHFKMINDVLGHATGDEAMRRIAGCMREEKRGPDVLARYGGDEFVLLLPETKAIEASVLLERIRAHIRQMGQDQGMSLSISCGIAERLANSDEAASEIMRRADLALYEAKNAGRNCVKLWDKDMIRLLAGTDLEIEKIRHLRRRIVGLSEKAEKVFMESIWGLVQALEAKDPYARKHSENVMAYSVGIAQLMELGPNYVDTIQRAAMIHDIGKIGVPDVILLKPDHLTPHERAVIEQHPAIAVRILEKMSFLEKEIPIVHHHHERWNGHGYPDGLARTAIPLGARILAVADTFDALTSTRAYHTPRTVAEAVHILKDSAGYELDPTVVAAMTAWVESIGKQLGTPPDQLTAEDLLADFRSSSAGQDPACSMMPAPAAS